MVTETGAGMISMMIVVSRLLRIMGENLWENWKKRTIILYVGVLASNLENKQHPIFFPMHLSFLFSSTPTFSVSLIVR